MQINCLSESLIPFQKKLLDWFAAQGRSFPWRATNNPYKILVAEKLLQQTSVRPDLVQIYKTLVSQYPTNRHLAEAETNLMIQIMYPLGLHYRATEMVELARSIEEKHGGLIPTDFNQLMQLPGIGDYIARAILCFAYEMDVPIVDTNIARILYRLFDIKEKFPQNPARKKSLIKLAASLVPQGMAKNFNFALLDLGALICQPQKPKCNVCPIYSYCEYGKMKGEVRNART